MREIYFHNNSITFNVDKKGNRIYSCKMILNNIIIVPVFWVEFIKLIFTPGSYHEYENNPLFVSAPDGLKDLIYESEQNSLCLLWKERGIVKFNPKIPYSETVTVNTSININEMKIINGNLINYTYLHIYRPYKKIS